MQKSMKSGPSACTPVNKNGSVLVGAVAISLIIAIAGIGFLQVNSSSLNNEAAFLENEQALQAAEAGVFLASTWLSQATIFPGSTTNPLGSNTMKIRGIDVSLSVIPPATGDSLYTIISEASKDGAFMKKIRVNIRSQNVTQYTTYFDEFYLDQGVKTTADDLWWGGYRGFTFSGRFHSNKIFIRIDPAAGPTGAFPTRFKNGLVTVGRNDALMDANPGKFGHQRYSNNGANLGHFGNNYDWGVHAKFLPAAPYDASDVALLDQVFQDRYIANVDQVSTKSIQTDGTKMATDPAVAANFTIITLDSSYNDNDVTTGSYYQYGRPTLSFEIIAGIPRYIYERKNASSQRKRDTLSYNSGTIFISKNNLNVKGKVRGAVTIATQWKKDICPIGNLYVEDYTVNPHDTTSVVPSNSTNIIGLCSGRTIRFNDSVRLLNSQGDDSVYSTKAVCKAVNNGSNDLMHITASLMALDTTFPDCYNDAGLGVTTTKGCMSMAGAIDGTTQCLHYGIKICGNQVMASYKSTKHGWVSPLWTQGLAENALVNVEDPRFQRMAPPGYSNNVKVIDAAGNERVLLVLSNWVEENKQ
jgi:hypothetical protein